MGTRRLFCVHHVWRCAEYGVGGRGQLCVWRVGLWRGEREWCGPCSVEQHALHPSPCLGLPPTLPLFTSLHTPPSKVHTLAPSFCSLLLSLRHCFLSLLLPRPCCILSTNHEPAFCCCSDAECSLAPHCGVPSSSYSCNDAAVVSSTRRFLRMTLMMMMMWL